MDIRALQYLLVEGTHSYFSELSGRLCKLDIPRAQITHVTDIDQLEAIKAETKLPWVVIYLSDLCTARALEKIAFTPIGLSGAVKILITAKEFEVFAMQALDMGIHDYLLREELQTRQLAKTIRFACERVQMQSELQQASGRFEAVFRNSGNATLLANDNGKYTDANPAAARMLGYTVDELKTMDISCIASEFSGKTKKRWQYFLKEQKEEGIIELRKKDGSEVIASYKSVANILPGLHLSVLTDITEQSVEYQRQKLLTKIFKASAARGNFQSRLAAILKVLTDSAGTSAMQLWWLDQRHENIFLEGSYTEKTDSPACEGDAPAKAVYMAVNKFPFLAEAITSGQPALMDDLANLQHFYREECFTAFSGMALLAIPVIREDNCQGILLGFMEVTPTTPVRAQSLISLLFPVAKVLSDEVEKLRIRFELDQVIMGSYDLISILSFEREFIKVNRAFEEAFHYNSQVDGKLFVSDLIPPESREHVEHLLAKALNGENIQMEDILTIAKNGEKKWIEVSATPNLTAGTIYLIGRDITSYKEAQQELVDANRKFHLATRTTQMGIWELDIRSDQVIFDNGVRAIYGLAEEEIPLNRSRWSRFLHPEDKQMVLDTFKTAIADAGNLEVQYRIIDARGDEKHVHVSAEIQRDEQGEAIAMIGLSLDVTRYARSEMEKAEALLRLNERIKEQRCLYNISKLQQQDLSIEEMLEKAVLLLPPAFQWAGLTAVAIEFNEKLYKTSNYLESSWQLSSQKYEVAGGLLKLTMVYLGEKPPSANSPFLKEEQQLVEAVAEHLSTAIDRNLSKQQLIEREVRFRNLIENNHDVILILDTNLRMNYASPSSMRLTGHSPEEILGTTSIIHVHPDDVESRNAAMNKLLTGEQHIVVFKERIKCKDGRYIWIEATVTDQREVPGINGYVFNLRNINAEENARKELELSQGRLDRAQRIARIGYWQFNIEEMESYWSDEVYDMYGLERGTAVNFEIFLKHIHPDDRHFFYADKMFLETGQQLDEIEYRLIKPSGEMVWMRNQTYVASAENGKAKVLEGTVQDINDRKLAELKLEEREERFRNLIENNYDVILIQDKNHLMSYASPSIEKMIGYPAEEVVGTNAAAYVHPDDLIKSAPLMLQLMAGEKRSINLKLRIKCKNGKYVWVYSIVTDQRKISGIEGLVYNFKDIDTEEKARNELELSQARLERAQEIARMGYWKTDFRTSETYWSKELYSLFGLEEGTIKLNYNSLIQRVHPDDRHLLHTESTKVQKGQKLNETEYRALKPNGDIFWVRGQTYVEKVENGKPVIVEGAIQDITDRKLTELKLEEHEQQFRLFMEHSPILSWLKDEEGRLLAANEVFMKATGRTADDLKKEPDEYYRDDSSPETRYHDIEVFRAGEAMQFVEEVPNAKGELRTYEVYKFPFKSDNKMLLGNFALDITEKKLHMEAIEKQNEKLREIAWLQSHVVRAPLARLMGLMELFTHHELSEEDQEKVITNINQAATELDDVIKDMVASSEEINLK